MADLFLLLTMVGETGPLPAPVPRGQVRTLRIAATDGAGGAAVAATGVAVEVRSPVGATVYSGGELTAAGTGVWTLPLALDARGAWVAQASATGPQAARSADLPILVLGSAADAPVPTPLGPAVVDAEQSAAEAAQSAEDAAEAAASALGAAPTLRHFASYTDLAAAAAAGTIPATVVRFTTGGRLAEGDGGAAIYIRRATLPAHAQYLADTGPGSGYLALEMRETPPEVFGAVGALRGDPATDSSAALQAMLDYHEARGGGVADFDTGLSYGLYTAGIIERPNVTIRMPWGGGDRRPSATGKIDWTGATGTPFPCLVVDASVVAVAVTARPNSAILGLNGRVRGLTLPPDGTATRNEKMAWWQATRRKIRGTFLSLGNGGGGALRGNDCVVRDVFALGFVTGIRGRDIPRTTFGEVWGDCNTLVQIDSAGDTVAFEGMIRPFPLLTLNSGATALARKVVLMADNGGKVALQLATAHATIIETWADNGVYAQARLADKYQSHVVAGDTVTISGAGALNGTRTVRSIDTTDSKRITLEVAWDAAYASLAGTFTSTAPDLSYLLPGDRLYLQDWVGVDPIPWTRPSVTVSGGVPTYVGKERYVLTVDGPTQITLDMAWDAALAAATCVVLDAPLARDGVGLMQNAGGASLNALSVKGSQIGWWSNVNIVNAAHYNYEPGDEGSGPSKAPGTVGLWIGRNVARFNLGGGNIKSADTLWVSEAPAAEGVALVAVQLEGAETLTGDLRDGNLHQVGCQVSNHTPKYRFADAVAPRDGVWVWGGYHPNPVLEMDAGSTEDPARRFHGFADNNTGDTGLWGTLRLLARRSTWGGGLSWFGTAGNRNYFASLGEDDVEAGELATLRIGPDLTNNPDGDVILGAVKNRTREFRLILDGSRTFGAEVDGQEVIRIPFHAREAGSVLREFARIAAFADSVTTGAASGALRFLVRVAGAVTERLRLNAAGADVTGTLTVNGNEVARADGESEVALPGVTGALARPWIARLLENITVRDTGALGDDSADDTDAFLDCIEYCRTRNLPIRVPTAEAAYRLTDTLPFYTRMQMVGVFGGNSLLRWRGGGDKHILARHNWADDDDGDVNYCGVADIRIDDFTATARRTGKVALNFTNGDTHTFLRMEYEGRNSRTSTGPGDDPREDLYGLLTGKHPAGSYTGTVWETRMIDCRFRRGQVWWNLTDGLISGGIIYALACAYALRLGGGNIVKGVHFIPGGIWGAIDFYNPDPAADIFNPAIVGCHNDGNNAAYAPHFLHARGDTPLINLVVTGNKAWNCSREAIRLLDCHGATIGNNAFRQNSAHGYDPADVALTPVAYPDIYIDGNDNDVGRNSYRRLPTYPKPDPGGTRTVLAPPVVFATGRTGNRLERGVVTPDAHGYSTTSFRHQAKLGENLLDGFREDWNGAAIGSAWTVALGTPGDGARAPAATLVNGELNLVLGDTSPSTQDANGVQIDRALVLRADRATPHEPLSIEAEIRVTNATGLAFFFGLANRVGAPVEVPFTLAGTTLSSPQANAVGFLFDTSAHADVIHCVGTNGGVDATPIVTSIAPAGGANYVLRIEIEVGGRASFFIDGELVGEMANAVTATAWLTAHVSAFSRSTVQKSLICRRIEAWQPNP